MNRYSLAFGIALCCGHAAFAGSNDSNVEEVSETADAGFAVPSNQKLNTSDIAQIGTGNHAVADQELGVVDGGSNASAIVQSGSENSAEINQISTGFSINESVVDQTGSSNRASLMQGGFLTNNISAIEQSGGEHEATVTQSGLGEPEEGPPLAELHSRIHQAGSLNRAQVDQSGGFARSTMQQDGTNQIAEVRQDGFSSRFESLVIQSGAANTAHITQTGDDGDSLSEIDVDGSFNLTDVVQESGGFQTPTSYRSVIAIDGAANTASVRQGGFDGVDISNMTLAGNANTVLVEQNSQGGTSTSEVAVAGASNQINVRQDVSAQSGTANLSRVDVNGVENRVDVVQRIFPVDGLGGAGGNTAQIEVDGSSNQISVEQDVLTPGATGATDYSIHAVGNGNVINVTQQQ